MAGTTRVLNFSEGATVNAPAQTFLSTTEFQTFASDAAYVTAKGSAASEGNAYGNTTDNHIHYYDGTAWRVVEHNKHNFAATTAPTVTDDSASSYSVGSIWIDVTADLIYIATDVSVGAAVWKEQVDANSTQSIGGAKTFTAAVIISDTTQSSSKDTGALIIEGGLGVEKNAYVGGNLEVIGDLTVQGTTTTLNTATLDVEDANVTVNKGGTVASADSAVSGLTVDTDATDARIGYDSTLASKFKAGDVGSESEVITASATQVMTGKRIAFSSANDATTTGSNATLAAFTTGIVRLTNGSLASISGIPAGSSGQNFIIENKTGATFVLNNEEATATAADRILTGTGANVNITNNASVELVYDSTSARWQLVGGTGSGSSSSSGGINYFSDNSDAEIGTTGLTTYSDGSATPVDLTGGSPTATITRTTSSPLRGTGSFLFTAGGIGDGVYSTITPDRADVIRGAVLYGSIDYEYSATVATGSYTIWLYDVANSLLVQPAGYQLQGGVAGIANRHIFSFQLSTNATTYRVAIHQAVASPGGNLKFDNRILGPQQIQYGVPVTDWESFTPTGSWTTNTTYAGKKRRIGDSLECWVKVLVSGAPTSATLTINLPSGLSIDTSKAPGTPSAAGDGNFGWADGADSGVGFHQGLVVYDTATSVRVAGDDGAVYWNATTPYTFAAGDFVEIRMIVPIAGWGSSVQMSSDSSEGRVVAAIITGNPASASAGNPFIVPTVSYDSHSGYNATTGGYTVKVPGIHKLYGAMTSSAGATNIFIYKNAVSSILAGTLDSGGEGTFCGSVNCIAGDVIDVRPDGVVDANTFGLNIERTSGNSSIAANESVNLYYTTAAGQSCTNNANTRIDFGTKVFNSHGDTVTTGASWVWTSGSSGKIRVTPTITFSANGTGSRVITISKNGSDYARFYGNTTASQLISVSGSTTMDVIAGTTVYVLAFQDSGGALTLNADAANNYISIERIGN